MNQAGWAFHGVPGRPGCHQRIERSCVGNLRARQMFLTTQLTAGCLNPIASAQWAWPMFRSPSRSAIVRATFNTRWHPRGDRLSCSGTRAGKEWATPGAGTQPAIFGQHPPHQMFVHADIESQGHLIGNPLVAEARIPSLHLHDGRDQLSRGTLGARLSAPIGRKQFSVLTLHQRPLKAQYRLRLSLRIGCPSALHTVRGGGALSLSPQVSWRPALGWNTRRLLPP